MHGLMRTISLKAGRRYWLLVLDGCEIGTDVRVSQPIEYAIRLAQRRFPGALVDAPQQTKPLFVSSSVR